MKSRLEGGGLVPVWLSHQFIAALDEYWIYIYWIYNEYLKKNTRNKQGRFTYTDIEPRKNEGGLKKK